MSISIIENKVVVIKDCNGREVTSGNTIILRIKKDRKKEDVVCRFKALEGGYFVTQTLDGEHENKYRKGSIDNCRRIVGIDEFQRTVEETTAEEE